MLQYILVFFTLISFCSQAVSQSSLNFTYGVLPLEQKAETSYDKILIKKIQKELLKLGPAETLPNYSIVVRPELIIYSSDLSATAPQYYTSNMELSLTISDYEGTVTFGSYDIPIKGAGRTVDKSIVNSIKNIRLGKAFNEFVSETNTKVFKYINDKADLILSEAKSIIDNTSISNEQNEIALILSRLGMLVHFDVKGEEAIGCIQELKVKHEENLCSIAKKQANFFLETNNFTALYDVFGKHPFCSFTIEEKEIQKRYDNYQSTKAMERDSIYVRHNRHLKATREYELDLKNNRSKGMDYLYESIGGLFKMF